MPTLHSRLGNWELPHVDLWKDRRVPLLAECCPLIGSETRVATIGSCFAEELASGLENFGLEGGPHPAGRFYNTRSIRQELERVAGGWPERHDEPLWPVDAGWVHPFKDRERHFADVAALHDWSNDLDAKADALFNGAEVVVATIGLIETWWNPTTKNVFRQIPHPEAFPKIESEFRRLTQAEMLEDLEVIRSIVCDRIGAELIVTVSPVPLDATMTHLDVQIANSESKSRIRSAVSEFIERHDDVHYFHSYELVTTAEVMSDFMLEDGRHVQPRAIDFILADFLRVFSANGVAIPEVDRSWLTLPTKTASHDEVFGGSAPTSLRARIRALLERAARRLR